MIDPPDRELSRFVEGTDTVVPGEGWGEFGDPPAGYLTVGPGSPKLYVQYYSVIPGNTKVTYFLDDIPDYWIVHVSAITNNGAFFYPYQDIMGAPVLVDAGGMAKIPGMTQHLTIMANGVGATVSTMAERGHPQAWMGT